jgi:hypothetical protein
MIGDQLQTKPAVHGPPVLTLLQEVREILQDPVIMHPLVTVNLYWTIGVSRAIHLLHRLLQQLLVVQLLVFLRPMIGDQLPMPGHLLIPRNLPHHKEIVSLQILELADDTPVPVMETKTGKVLCGPSALKVANVEHIGSKKILRMQS